MKTEKKQDRPAGKGSVPDDRAPADCGCLLVHGYGGSPFEMEGLEGALRVAGFAVRNTCLPGHGEEDVDFASQRFQHWLGHVDREYEVLAGRCATVAVVGFSLGGTLALNLAARRPVSAVVCIATPLYVLSLLPWPLEHLRLYARSVMAQARRMLNRTEPDKAESRAIAPWKGYARPLNLRQLASFRRGCADTRRLLPGIDASLLVMHDRHDRLVYVGNALEIARRVSSPATLRLTAIREAVTRHHMLTTHRETRDYVESEVVAFVKENASGGPRGSAPWEYPHGGDAP